MLGLLGMFGNQVCEHSRFIDDSISSLTPILPFISAAAVYSWSVLGRT